MLSFALNHEHASYPDLLQKLKVLFESLTFTMYIQIITDWLLICIKFHD